MKDIHEAIDFQTDYVVDLAKLSDYGYDLNMRDLFHTWEQHKRVNIVTYRDQPHYSKYTGKKTPAHHTKWWVAMDDSKEAFLAGYKGKEGAEE